MNNGKIIASRYAQALLQIAKKESRVELISEEIEAASQYWQKNEGIKNFLNNPDFTKEEKKELTKRFFTAQFSDTFFNFLYLLIDKNRLNCLPDISDEYKRLLYQLRGIEEIKVVLSRPADKSLLDILGGKIKEIVGKPVELTIEVNPEMLGGVSLHFKDKIIDGSIKHNLKYLKERLLEAKVA